MYRYVAVKTEAGGHYQVFCPENKALCIVDTRYEADHLMAHLNKTVSLKHIGFSAQAQSDHDFIVDVIPVRFQGEETQMAICASQEAIYITKEQAMQFFGLVPNPQ